MRPWAPLLAVMIGTGCAGPADEASSPNDPTPTPSGTASPTPTPDDFPAPVLDECITDGSAGSHVFSCSDLTFNVNVPELCLSQACGLIVDVHGLTMSGQMEENNTRLAERAGAVGYLVVQPNATPDPPNSKWDGAVDDDKVYDFLQRSIAAWHLDENRVHFTGFSQGGFMTWRMVCAHPETFASVAPAAAADGCAAGVDVACSTFPAQQVDILYMHGTQDRLISYDCAEPQRDSVRTAWGLDDEQTLESDASHQRLRYSNASGTELEFIRHDYTGNIVLGGHCFPGSSDTQGGEPGQLFGFACDGPTAFDWGQAVLQFFLDHPK